jgi:hypothetical protein
MKLSYLAADAGRLRESRGLGERALASWRDFVPYGRWGAMILLHLAELDVELGEPERVRERLEQAIENYRHMEDEAGVAECEARLRTPPNAVLTPE